MNGCESIANGSMTVQYFFINHYTLVNKVFNDSFPTIFYFPTLINIARLFILKGTFKLTLQYCRKLYNMN